MPWFNSSKANELRIIFRAEIVKWNLTVIESSSTYLSQLIYKRYLRFLILH